MTAEEYIKNKETNPFHYKDRLCADINIKNFAFTAVEMARQEEREKAIDAFKEFVVDYCEESGRTDISSDSEHYIECFKSLLNK